MRSAPADQAGAHQRRGVHIVQRQVLQRKAVLRVGHDMGGEAAVAP
jgi:hypothetical protein